MINMNNSEIDQLLERTRIGRLAMVGKDLQPYVIPMPFCWLNDFLYLRLPNTGRKGSILEANNKVCFEVDWYTESLSDYASVIIEGTIAWVNDLEEKEIVHAENTRKYLALRKGLRPGHGRNTELVDLPLQKITPTVVSGRKRNPTTQMIPVTSDGVKHGHH